MTRLLLILACLITARWLQRRFAVVNAFHVGGYPRKGSQSFVVSLAQAPWSSQPRQVSSSIHSKPTWLHRSSYPLPSSTTKSTTQLYVFDRMTEDCIGAIVVAQKQAVTYSQTHVECSFLVAGIVDVPETPAMKRTLKQYDITWRKVQRVLQDMYPSSSSSSSDLKSLGSFFQGRDPNDDLPFGKDVQRTLKAAGKIADQMKSTQIQTHHILLALSSKPSRACCVRSIPHSSKVLVAAT